MGMNEAYAIMQQVIEKKARQTTEDQQKIDVQQKSNQIFTQEVVDQLMSENGYREYRITLDIFGEYQVEMFTKNWGWEHVDTIGFRSKGKVKMYKTLNGALKRAKKEIEFL